MFKRRLISTCMAALMMAMLVTGCGKSEKGSEVSDKEVADSKGGDETESDDSGSGTFYVGETRAELLYGRHMVDKDTFMPTAEDYDDFMDGMGIVDFDNDGTNIRLSAVPWEIDAGRCGYKSEDSNLFSQYNFPKEEDIESTRTELVSKYGADGIEYFNNYMESLNAPFMSAQYILESDSYGLNSQIATFVGYYKVSGNTVTLYWDEPDAVTYEIKYEKPAISFDFNFTGNGDISVSNSGSSAVLRVENRNPTASPISKKLLVNGYITDGDDALNGIANIHFISDFSASVLMEDGRDAYGVEMSFEDNGEFTISWKGTAVGFLEKDETPCVIKGNYLYCYGSGLILTVDGKTYYYTATEREYFGNTFDDIDIENINGDEIATLANVQKNIREELKDAFEKAGINVKIDEKTGEVVTDDSILFGVDESDVSEDGKAYLDKFLEVYAEVIQPYIDEGHIAEIMVEGHTDTSGSYEYNLELSEKRAKSVADYCVEKQPSLSGVINSKGYSFESPVLDANGNIDMNASRRVAFSFKMSTGK